jgi:hypothetical protein
MSRSYESIWDNIAGYTTSARVDERHKRGATRGNGATRVRDDASCPESQRDNQPDKRYKRGMMRGGGAMRGGGTGRWEVAASQEMTRQIAGADERQTHQRRRGA